MTKDTDTLRDNLPANIELRNVKHAVFASEETNCFQAAVYIDGKKAGEVSNEGHGGSNSYHPWELHDTLNAIAANYSWSCDWSGELQTHHHDADTLIGEYFQLWADVKMLKQITSGRLSYIKDGQVLTTNKPKQAATLDVWMKDPALAGLPILNLLPQAEALALLRQYG